MSQYITAAEFLASPYGSDYQPGESFFDELWQVDDFLTYISSIIDLYCGREFGVTSYTDYITGAGSKVIFLNFFPVTEITSVTLIDDNGDETAISSGGYFNLNSGKVKFVSELDDGKIYKVVYSAGYSTIPDAIKQATLMLAHTYAQSIDSGSVGIADGGSLTGFKFGKFQETYADPRQRIVSYSEGIPITVQAILRRYRYMR